MIGIEHLVIFIGSGILLNLYPGQDTFYVLGRSLSQGRAAGISAALGISSGGVVHTLLGAAGLSALLGTSPAAFSLVKYAGAAYLIFQGVRLLVDSSVPADERGDGGLSRKGLLRIYRQGALTNILNPKVALFFLAFLPQFIEVSSEHKVLAFMLLGAIFITTGTIWCLILAWCASTLSRRLRRSATGGTWLKKANGLLLTLLGLTLAASSLE